ncbi:uncharacterized protein LOC115565467 [Drosophila navojoa]|uniref:uncharacterized protein LOC115565467 n=1 Tax=Drosophila navojoa TaxID=7232 RepID=UPI0011BD6EED|nr:uncharacterized protein LOC115565467 [Drosophila navojoa]
MLKPPDINTTTKSIYTKYQNLNNPKYIVINRKDNKSFENVSPFLIKKTIDYTCGGEVDLCKKTRAGTLLIKTKNTLPTMKLLKIKNMADIEVEAAEHKALNFSKGEIYCNELRNIEEAEILDELKPQSVTEVRKIFKKQDQGMTETGLIVTFATHNLPEAIKIGYESTRVRPYIPLPLRCRKCLRFGHPTLICKSTEDTYKNCSQTTHTTENETCTNEKCCLNCINNSEVDPKHSPLDRNCPTFLKQQELVAIKTTEKVDHKTVLSIYHSRHNPQLSNSYASTLTKAATNQDAHSTIPKTNTVTTTSTPTHSKKLSSAQQTNTTPQPISYHDLLSEHPRTSRIST